VTILFLLPHNSDNCKAVIIGCISYTVHCQRGSPQWHSVHYKFCENTSAGSKLEFGHEVTADNKMLRACTTHQLNYIGQQKKKKKSFLLPVKMKGNLYRLDVVDSKYGNQNALSPITLKG
jgi:hypothetical protein